VPPSSQLESRTEVLDEAVREFLVESNEGLDRFEHELVQLEQEGHDAELLDSIFRVVHTIKGSGGTLGFRHLLELAHAGESVLSRLREGRLRLSASVTSTLLAMSDALRRILREIEASGREADGDYAGLVQRLSQIVLDRDPAPAADPAPAGEPAALPSVGEILVTNRLCPANEVRTALQQQEGGDPRRVGEILVARGAVSPGALADALQLQAEHRDLASSTIRVDVTRLDTVMNLVGELVLARNQMLGFAETRDYSALPATTQRLDAITTELQEAVMKTRMQPIGRLWDKLPRTVRDLAVSCGKQVEVICQGEDTDLDKTVLDAIRDPLTHIVRNAVDHGIEPPQLRLARGKPPAGRLQLRAFHEGGQVHIEISDDGAGIRGERLRDKAVAAGWLDAGRAAGLSPAELLNLIFIPGLSTAAAVTSVSGRGVGMDVVKTNIEKIGGTIQLASSPGEGTQLKIRIPLTLTIIPALLVAAGGQRFAIPQASVVELVQLAAGRRGLETIGDAAVYRLRGRLLPLLWLARLLQLAPGPPAEQDLHVVVLRDGERQFGLIVDEISDSREIVVKPLCCALKTIPCFAGATILGDGSVALILDVAGLARSAALVATPRASPSPEAQSPPAAGASAEHSWLLFRLGRDGRSALPLSQVLRLEEIPASRVERAGGRDVVQYGDQLMPLVRLSPPPDAAADSGMLQVIVHTDGGRAVGLVVDEILDIVEPSGALPATADVNSPQPLTVLQQRVTRVLDLPRLLRARTLSAAGELS